LYAKRIEQLEQEIILLKQQQALPAQPSVISPPRTKIKIDGSHGSAVFADNADIEVVSGAISTQLYNSRQLDVPTQVAIGDPTPFALRRLLWVCGVARPLLEREFTGDPYYWTFTARNGPTIQVAAQWGFTLQIEYLSQYIVTPIFTPSNTLLTVCSAIVFYE